MKMIVFLCNLGLIPDQYIIIRRIRKNYAMVEATPNAPKPLYLRRQDWSTWLVNTAQIASPDESM